MNYLNVLAKALYDNVAESPDELSFRKGDIMTVLERDTQGLDGWWLCSLHGRQGIVPGNRLKILVGMYDKQQHQGQQGQQQQQQQQTSQPSPAQSTLTIPQSAYSKPSPSTQYTDMHPAFSSSSPAGPSTPNSHYMLPPTLGKPSPSSLYQVPTGPQGPQGPPKTPALTQKQSNPAQYHPTGQDIYQVPPSMSAPGQDIYQVPPPAGGPSAGQDIYQVPPSMNQTQDIYQIPPSIEKRSWDSSKPMGKVVVPTRVGQVYVYGPGNTEQDEYDVPRHLPPSQDIYDVPPTRAQYSQQVYDTPPMAMKGPPSRDPQEIYDTPPNADKSQSLSQQVYDFPPSVSKDVPDIPIREETYDVPPHFAKMKSPDNQNQSQLCQGPGGSEPFIPEDVYDVPPPPLTGKRQLEGQEIYDIPASLRKGGPHDQHLGDVYDFPRERSTGDESGDYVYDVPPQVVRDAAAAEELTVSFKRLSASSTGSTRSNLSNSSLDMVPVRESSVPGQGVPSRLLILDLEQAMERLSRLQQAVESSVSLLMSFISGNWRSPTQMEANLPAIRQAADRVRAAVRDLLEFARGAVANAAQATDRTLQAKLGKQVQKMEEAFQGLVKHSQGLDALGWAPSALLAPPAGSGGDDLDKLVMCARGVPDDTKQLASFLHGNASLLFKRTNKQQLPLPPLPHSADTLSQLTNNNNISAYQTGTPERANIQSRPLPSPPKFTAEEETPDRPYETTEEGWMEDYDYVHLQGKEEFEKNQRELLAKGNITRQHKTQLEQQQLKQFERLEQEVTRPINNDISGWTPPPHYPHTTRSKLSTGDRQLLLFYFEQCESNITTLTNAIDAFYSSINNNQPPKIFVAHSKFVILSAHKLVFIGDTLSRQAKSPEVRARVAQHSNTLCDKLKDIVVSTKTAALQYPSPGAARDMTERVRELAGCTQQFRMALSQLIAM
ncbi:breast cancer anti-estrogen resistance protein 1 isoform X1 [Chanos chanos]|uniref:Breast cancer anti-estrogen resistance protein 1 n=1 Tax=Chanos chanos TaxID=29144 RepID=A0A6J2X0U4_CHACN|nr:breast cancer anti-estrogen resistance protein 1 isoform X1 [Chanos chanos]